MRTRLFITLQIMSLLFGVTISSLFISKSNTWHWSMPILLIAFFAFVIDLTKNGLKHKNDEQS